MYLRLLCKVNQEATVNFNISSSVSNGKQTVNFTTFSFVVRIVLQCDFLYINYYLLPNQQSAVFLQNGCTYLYFMSLFTRTL